MDRPHIESITVTARKVEQDLQSTGEAVSAFTGAELDTRGIGDLKDLGRIVPNVRLESVPGTGNTATATIRGLSQPDLLITGDPSVGIYVDGVYHARLVGANLALFDLERVEILRGPQGTLYGKNTPAGAINLWSRRPEPELGGYLRGTYGSDERQELEGALGFPILGEQLSGRIAFLSRDDDGYLRNHSALGVTSGVGGGVGDQNGQGVRVSTLWEPSEKLEISAQGFRHRERRKSGFPHQVSYVDPALAGFPIVLTPAQVATWTAFLEDSDPDDVYLSFRGRQDLETTGGSGAVSYDLGPAELRYRGGYHEYQYLSGTDLDGSPLSLFDIGRPENPQDEKSRQSSHELSAAGGALDDRLEYTGGLYFSDERSSNTARQYFDSAGLSFLGEVVSRIRSWALYSQGSWALGERLRLVLGARHTEERREVTRPLDGVRYDFSRRWDSTTWLSALELQADDDTFLYLEASTGYRSGGWNGRADTPEALGTPFDEEFVTSYETGIKRDWFDGRLRSNLALFYLKYEDIQNTEIRPTGGGAFASFIVNSGNADVSGGEVELWFEPTASLRLGGTTGWNWFRPRDGPEEINNPHLTWSAFGELRSALGSLGLLSTRLELQGQTRSLLHLDDPATPAIVSPTFGILNGRIGLELPQPACEIALIGTNLLDREYYTAGIDFAASGLGYQTRYWAPGRRVALELTWRFGAEAP